MAQYLVRDGFALVHPATGARYVGVADRAKTPKVELTDEEYAEVAFMVEKAPVKEATK
jgi:hypothetical protein